jgi:hypothetical protein
MKRNTRASIGLIAFFTVVIVLLNTVSDSGVTSVYASSGGSDGGMTNSPGDIASLAPGVANCTSCHSTSPLNSGSGTTSITSTVLSSGYVPGQTYTITGTVSEVGISSFGFEITAEKDADDSKTGTLIVTNTTNTKIVGGTAVTQKPVGVTGVGSKSWAFNWTAPVAGTGDVTFYGAFNAGNSNGAAAGDYIYTATPLSVSEDLSVGLVENLNAVTILIFPNPVKTSFEISTTKKIDDLVIYNLVGKRMINVRQDVNSFDTSALDAGIYFVQIKSEGKVMIKKIIKE